MHIAFQPITVVSHMEKSYLKSEWYIDPNLGYNSLVFWRLCGRAIIKYLQWDPDEWKWIGARHQEKILPFF